VEVLGHVVGLGVRVWTAGRRDEEILAKLAPDSLIGLVHLERRFLGATELWQPQQFFDILFWLKIYYWALKSYFLVFCWIRLECMCYNLG